MGLINYHEVDDGWDEHCWESAQVSISYEPSQQWHQSSNTGPVVNVPGCCLKILMNHLAEVKD